MDSDSDESSQSIEEVDWFEKLQRIKENDPHMTMLEPGVGDYFNHIENMTDGSWEELGRDISNNTHLTNLDLYGSALNDHRMSCLFRGLTRSSSIREIQLYNNRLSAAGLRSMIPFLQNADNLAYLDIDDNNIIQSAGFNLMFRALSDSPIDTLRVNRCYINSIEIDSQHIPQNLTTLQFDGNNINSDGCREIAKLLKGGSATLNILSLEDNKIDDEGVEILVDALKNNTSLTHIYLGQNRKISIEGMKSCLRLVNDISSINATLQSNHTLQMVCVNVERIDADFEIIRSQINGSVLLNRRFRDDLDRVGKEKIIQLQLNSGNREELADIQGVSHSLYSEIDPLYLPEVLALVGHRHRQGDMYVALKSSIAGVISTVNRRECIKQQWEYHLAKAKQLEAELAAMDEAERKVVGIERDESRNSKRRRK